MFELFFAARRTIIRRSLLTTRSARHFSTSPILKKTLMDTNASLKIPDQQTIHSPIENSTRENIKLENVENTRTTFPVETIHTIQADNRPDDYEYALISQHVYKEIKKGDVLPQKNWKVKEVFEGNSDYFGAIYFNTKTHQTVFAHRGTNSIGALWEDFKGIYINQSNSYQRRDIFDFIDKAIAFSEEMGYQLSFTGHSLGAFLAELSVFYCTHNSKNYLNVSAVTFESPGCREAMEELQPNHNQGKINLDTLDIVSYLTYPNYINTFNHHVGTVYTLKPDVSKAWFEKANLLQIHTIGNIVKLFENDIKDSIYTPKYVTDWPIASERNYFFNHAKLENGRYTFPEITKENENERKFELNFNSHFHESEKYNSKNTLPLIHFSPNMKAWLEEFYKILFNHDRAGKLQKFVEEISDILSDEKVSLCLLSCRIISTQNGIKLFVCINNECPTINEIRKELSNWLESNREVALNLISGLREKESSDADIEATAMENADITGTGKIEKISAKAVNQKYPQNISDEEIEKMNKITRNTLNAIKQTRTKLKATAVKGKNIINIPIGEIEADGYKSEMTPSSNQSQMLFGKSEQINQIIEKTSEPINREISGNTPVKK